MNTINQEFGPITLVISEVVAPDRVREYEAWTKGINQAASQFAGFMGVNIIRPHEHDHSEYVVIVKFDDYGHFRQWMASPTYQEWMEKSRGLVSTRVRQQIPIGIDLWFSLPPNAAQMAEPAFYKKVVLGVLAVYPLILLANALLGPLLKGLPSLLALLISVTFVSALLTYPVMPWLSKLLGFWLYPAARPKRRNLRRSVRQKA